MFLLVGSSLANGKQHWPVWFNSAHSEQVLELHVPSLSHVRWPQLLSPSLTVLLPSSDFSSEPRGSQVETSGPGVQMRQYWGRVCLEPHPLPLATTSFQLVSCAAVHFSQKGKAAHPQVRPADWGFTSFSASEGEADSESR